MNTLVVNQSRKFRIVEKDGAVYMLAMSGGVFEQEIAIALKPNEVDTLLADPDKQIRLADLIIKNPSAFEERRVRPSL